MEFNNEEAQRVYDTLMEDLKDREQELQSSSLNPNDVQQFMIDNHIRIMEAVSNIDLEVTKSKMIKIISGEKEWDNTIDNVAKVAVDNVVKVKKKRIVDNVVKVKGERIFGDDW